MLTQWNKKKILRRFIYYDIESYADINSLIRWPVKIQRVCIMLTSTSQSAFTYSKSKIEAPEQYVKSVWIKY